MSTDWSVLDDEAKEYRHLGQRFTTGCCFGYGSNDVEGRADAAQWISERLDYGKSLRIVLTDDIPEDYANAEG